MKKFKVFAFLGFAALSGSIYLYFVSLNAKGICIANGETLSDDRLLELAIKFLYKEERLQGQLTDYPSIIQKYPDCCRVLTRDYGDGSIFLSSQSAVQIVVSSGDQDVVYFSDNKIRDKYTFVVFFNSCGRYKNYSSASGG